MKWFLFFAASIGMFSSNLEAQIVRVSPAFPTVEDSVSIWFNAREGNRALEGYDGEVYMHTGLILGSVNEPGEWQYIQGQWAKDDPKVLMEWVGPDLYHRKIHIRSFYGTQENESFIQMVFVFRNEDGSKVATPADEHEAYYPRLETLQNRSLWTHATGLHAPGPGAFKQLESKDDMLILHTENGQLELTVLEDGIIQMNYLRSEDAETPSLSALDKPTFQNRLIEHSESAKDLTLKWDSGYRMILRKSDLQFRIEDKKGQTILETERGLFSLPKGGLKGLRWTLQDHEKLMGTGARAIPMDRRGRRLPAYNLKNETLESGDTELGSSIPFIFSSNGYAILFDANGKGWFDLGEKEKDIAEFGAFSQGSFSFYILLSKEPKEILRKLSLLAGKQAMPPLWALGLIQSRSNYNSELEPVSIAQRTLKAGFPLDAVVLNASNSANNRVRAGRAFEEALNSLNNIGIKSLLKISPYFSASSSEFLDLFRQNYFSVTPGNKPYVLQDSTSHREALLDIFKPEAAKWLSRKTLHYLNLGVAAWYTERDVLDRHPYNMQHAQGRSDETHNLYPLFWSRALSSAYDTVLSNQRPFNLSEASSTGAASWGNFPQIGNSKRSWSGFRAQVPAILGAGISGQAYMHGDLGGSSGESKDNELYTRWFQFGVFSPIMRTHSTDIAIEPIFQDTQTQERVMAALQFRYQMLPYNYTLAWESHINALPPARPLWLHYPDDLMAYEFDDQYLWGENMLVKPITNPGISFTEVYFPKGQWVDYYTDGISTGPFKSRILLDIDHIPLYVKRGSTISTVPFYQQTQQYSLDTLIFHHYFSANNLLKAEIYHDDGLSFEAYERGAYKLIHIEPDLNKDKFSITFSRSGQMAPENHELYFIVHLLPNQPKWLKWKNQKLLAVSSRSEMHRQADTFYWDGANYQLHLHVRWDEKSQNILAKLK